MPEKKPKPRRKPDDLRKKYPVDKILSQAEELSIEKLAKEFKLTVLVIHKIIKRYGSDELKKIVSGRHPKAKKEAEKKESLQEVQKYMNNLETYYTSLQTPTIYISDIVLKMTKLSEHLHERIYGGDEKIKIIIKGLNEKEIDPDLVDKTNDTLWAYLGFDLKASRLLLMNYRELISAQEKYVKLEVIARELLDTKTLINCFFESFNVLDVKSYRKVKDRLTTLAPATEGYFSTFEESYNTYRAERTGQTDSGAEQGVSEAGSPKEETSTNNNK